MSDYINYNTGTTIGPLRIQRNGPFLYSGDETYSDTGAITDNGTTYHVLKIFHTPQGSDFSDFITSGSYKPSNLILVQIPTPPMQVTVTQQEENGELLYAQDAEGNTLKDSDGNSIPLLDITAQANLYTIPNIEWVINFVYGAKDKITGTTIDTRNFATRTQLEDLNSRVTTNESNLKNISEHVTIIEEWKENLSKDWILDGGDCAWNERN